MKRHDGKFGITIGSERKFRAPPGKDIDGQQVLDLPSHAHKRRVQRSVVCGFGRRDCRAHGLKMNGAA